jgi:hypothetical protein
MEKATINEVLTSVDRYKLFVLRISSKDLGSSLASFQAKGLPTVNIGLELSKFLKELGANNYLHFEAYDYVKKVLDMEKQRVTTNGNEVVVIYNLGILQETFLQLNAVQLFKDFSKAAALILIWEYTISDRNVLTWPSQHDHFNFDFSDFQIKYVEDAL